MGRNGHKGRDDSGMNAPLLASLDRSKHPFAAAKGSGTSNCVRWVFRAASVTTVSSPGKYVARSRLIAVWSFGALSVSAVLVWALPVPTNSVVQIAAKGIKLVFNMAN
jgi:hypothetical protein